MADPVQTKSKVKSWGFWGLAGTVAITVIVVVGLMYVVRYTLLKKPLNKFEGRMAA